MRSAILLSRPPALVATTARETGMVLNADVGREHRDDFHRVV